MTAEGYSFFKFCCSRLNICYYYVSETNHASVVVFKLFSRVATWAICHIFLNITTYSLLGYCSTATVHSLFLSLVSLVILLWVCSHWAWKFICVRSLHLLLSDCDYFRRRWIPFRSGPMVSFLRRTWAMPIKVYGDQKLWRQDLDPNNWYPNQCLKTLDQLLRAIECIRGLI